MPQSIAVPGTSLYSMDSYGAVHRLTPLVLQPTPYKALLIQPLPPLRPAQHEVLAAADPTHCPPERHPPALPRPRLFLRHSKRKRHAQVSVQSAKAQQRRLNFV